MVSRFPTVGIVGVGQLGHPVAENLLQAGHAVLAYQRTREGTPVEGGGQWADTPAQLAQQVDALFLCLPSEEAAEAVLEGETGVLAGLRSGQIVIELGTYRKSFKLALARKIQAKGAQVLEAEVSGSPVMVRQHKAALYLGGASDLVETCRPLLEAISPNLFHIGPFGSAVAMKLIANYLLAIHNLAAAEAMNMAVRAGFDPQRAVEVLREGAGGSMMFSVRAPMMAKRQFSPAPGPFRTLEKYLELGREMADELGCATPLFSAAEPYYQQALDGAMRDEDIAAVIKLLEAQSRQVGDSR